MKRILVIRGGAIGDFILTLPAIKLLRDRYPHAHLEILGYKHIVALAEKRFYAQAVRSIEYGALASFFARDTELPNELCDYFQSFDLVVSYLFDPDQIFLRNLNRAGVEMFLACSPKVIAGIHAAEQLAQPLEQLDLVLRDPYAEIFLTLEDREIASRMLGPSSGSMVAFHPGSGSATKNWPPEKWTEFGRAVSRLNPSCRLIVIAGEADSRVIAQLRENWAEVPVRFFVDEPLPIVAALLARAGRFIGHDSGISHIAAAVGARCTLLFGPTDPAVWAPKNPGVRVLRPASKNLGDLEVATVIAALTS